MYSSFQKTIYREDAFRLVQARTSGSLAEHYLCHPVHGRLKIVFEILLSLHESYSILKHKYNDIYWHQNFRDVTYLNIFNKDLNIFNKDSNVLAFFL